MARINVNQLLIVRIVRIEGVFHKLPLYFITRKVLENRGLSALSALNCIFEVEQRTQRPSRNAEPPERSFQRHRNERAGRCLTDHVASTGQGSRLRRWRSLGFRAWRLPENHTF